MKRKMVTFLFLVVSVFSLCAFDWPPEPYEMPRTVLTSEMLKYSLSGLFRSIGSIGNTGLLILGILISCSILGIYFEQIVLRPLRVHQGVKRNQLRRDIKVADRKKNMEFIVQDRVAEMEINHAAKQRFREIHPEYDLEERIYQRELSYSASLEFAKRHPIPGPGRRRKKR